MRSGIESVPPAENMQSLNHWIARKVPKVIFFKEKQLEDYHYLISRLTVNLQ